MAYFSLPLSSLPAPPLLRCAFTTLAEEVLKLPPGIICLTGGGGKSTLMYALGASLARRGNRGSGARVLLTTTTRIIKPLPSECPAFLQCDAAKEVVLPPGPGFLVAARPAGPGQKPDYLCGFSREEIDGLWEREIADWIIVEADGSACRALKAPAEKEPVIPSRTGAVIAVAGLSALGNPFSDSTVFRPDAFAALTGLQPGDMLLPEAVAAIFRKAQGLFKDCPETAQRLVFFNQADIPGALEAGIALARAVLQRQGAPLHGVYAGSAQQPHAPCLSFALAPA